MKIRELINKRAKGEELTVEELAFLKEYDESIADISAKLELEKQAKALAEERFKSADTELQDKLKALTELTNTVETARAEKEAIEKLLETQKTTAEVLVERAKHKAEEEAKREREAKAREKVEAENKAKAEMEEYKNRLLEAESRMAITNFRLQMMSEKATRPYLATEIDLLLAEVDTKGVEFSKSMFEYFVKAKNHEEEMANLKNKQEAGTSIFEDLKKNVEVNQVKTPSEEERILARAMKLGLRIRK